MNKYEGWDDKDLARGYTHAVNVELDGNAPGVDRAAARTQRGLIEQEIAARQSEGTTVLSTFQVMNRDGGIGGRVYAPKDFEF